METILLYVLIGVIVALLGGGVFVTLKYLKPIKEGDYVSAVNQLRLNNEKVDFQQKMLVELKRLIYDMPRFLRTREPKE